MSAWPEASAAPLCQAGLDQRVRLLGAVWDDVQDTRRSALHAMVPPRFLPPVAATPARVRDYAADLVHGADGAWRVVRDRVGRHPGAALLEAPVLAVFLPALCRALLGQALLLPSLPVWWLADGATRSLLASPRRFSVRDGFDPEHAPLALAALPSASRVRLQRRVERQPYRFVIVSDHGPSAMATVSIGSGHVDACDRRPAWEAFPTSSLHNLLGSTHV